MNNRRKTPRVMVRVLVDFGSSDTYFYSYSNNVSEGGIFIGTDTPMEVGSSLTLRFTLPGIDRVFESEGRVAWIYDPASSDEEPPKEVLGKGMGIEFSSIDSKDKDLIRVYVEQILSTKP